MKVTIERVFANVKQNKFGEKLSVGLKIKEPVVVDINGVEHAAEGKYINAWFPKDYTFPHKEGDVIDILIKERNGYLDFAFPKPGQQDNSELAARVAKLEAAVFGAKEEPAQPEAVDPDDF